MSIQEMDTEHNSTKSDTRKKPSQSAINRLIFALRGIGHTVSLQPYNGRIMPVIVKVAA